MDKEGGTAAACFSPSESEDEGEDGAVKRLMRTGRKTQARMTASRPSRCSSSNSLVSEPLPCRTEETGELGDDRGGMLGEYDPDRDETMDELGDPPEEPGGERCVRGGDIGMAWGPSGGLRVVVVVVVVVVLPPLAAAVLVVVVVVAGLILAREEVFATAVLGMMILAAVVRSAAAAAAVPAAAAPALAAAAAATAVGGTPAARAVTTTSSLITMSRP